jgi:hypothetical protein
VPSAPESNPFARASNYFGAAQDAQAPESATTIGAVPLTAIVVHVTRSGTRTDELLAAFANQLERDTQAPDERAHVRILLKQPVSAAWQRVYDALEAAGDDWHEHLHLNPQPNSIPHQ